MERIEINDLIVIIPGITGSVLSKNGKPIWGTKQTMAQLLFYENPPLAKDLILTNDSKVDHDIGDDVVPTELIKFPQMVAGLVKTSGYRKITDELKSVFELREGALNSVDQSINYIEFPYDWRRTNVFTANRLKEVIDHRLRLLRESEERYENAEVILIAHSMGGLISRYYLEVLEGRETCKALYTMGTPHRGAVETLGYVSNGYKMLRSNLTEVMRSCNSIYELMPEYYCFEKDGDYQKLNNVPGIENIDYERLENGLQFYLEIEEAVARNKSKKSYDIIPIVGISQPTYQSANFKNGAVHLTDYLPDEGDSIRDGDGRVPRLAAIPKELRGKAVCTFTHALHASIPDDEVIIEKICQDVIMIINGEHPNFRGGQAEGPGLQMKVKDVYYFKKEISVFVGVVNAVDSEFSLKARVEAIEATEHYDEVLLLDSGENSIGPLGVGFYKITLFNQSIGVKIPPPISDYFVVVKESS